MIECTGNIQVHHPDQKIVGYTSAREEMIALLNEDRESVFKNQRAAISRLVHDEHNPDGEQ